MCLRWFKGFFARARQVLPIWRASPQPRNRIPESFPAGHRRSLVLSALQKNPGASVNAIHRAAGHGGSMKATYRDLCTLIAQGAAFKTGQRRWTRYYPIACALPW
jgi:hypothetical protein